MRIVIDARMYGLENAGIGRYIINLINELVKIDQKNDYFILLRKKYFKTLQFNNPRFQKVLSDFNHYSILEQILLPFKLLHLKPDITHFPHFNIPVFWPGKFVITIHDLIKNNFRGSDSSTRHPWLYWLKYVVYRLLIYWAIKRSKLIITPSFYWQKIIAEQFKISPEKIIVTYEGIDKTWQNKKITNNDYQTVFKKYSIIKPFVLYVGNLYPHKNVERLIEAIKKIKTNLVIVCSRNIFRDRLQKLVNNKDCNDLVTFTGFVPDDDLYQLYHESLALIFPSLMEGFGLPGLEAMIAGTAVVASNSSCLPEIYGKAALYFNPYSIEDMADKINLIKNDRQLRDQLIQSSKIQLKKYDWEIMARQTLAVYNQSNSL